MIGTFLLVAIGLALSNFAYEGFRTAGIWQIGLDRLVAQLTALLAAYIALRIGGRT